MYGEINLIIITVSAQGIFSCIFTGTLFNILVPVQRHYWANFSFNKWLCSSSNSDLEFLSAPSPAYKEVKRFHESVDFEGNKQWLKAELRL